MWCVFVCGFRGRVYGKERAVLGLEEEFWGEGMSVWKWKASGKNVALG